IKMRVCSTRRLGGTSEARRHGGPRAATSLNLVFCEPSQPVIHPFKRFHEGL
ncbi:hypothetical protein TorRG33x02_326400, partial [Trema orientale]